MEEQLSLLIALQKIDTKIRTATEEKNKLPDILATLERRRAEGREELDKAREALQTAQKNKRDRDKDLEAGIKKIEKLKSRTSDIKTNKEYTALLKEIETAEQEDKAIEDEILGLMEKIDAAAEQIAAAEKGATLEEAGSGAEKKKRRHHRLSPLRPHPVFSRSDRTKEHLTEQLMSPRRHGEFTIAERHALIITYQLDSTQNEKNFSPRRHEGHEARKELASVLRGL